MVRNKKDQKVKHLINELKNLPLDLSEEDFNKKIQTKMEKIDKMNSIEFWEREVNTMLTRVIEFYGD